MHEARAKSGKKDLLLSITMPTLNQPDKIRRGLQSLLGEATEEMEILIRDDSPNNDTEDIVHEFQKYLPIRYVHGEKEGVDRALLFLTAEARGKYVWWLGDDQVKPGAVNRFLSLVRERPELDFIYINSGSTEDPLARSINLGGSKEFKNRDEVLVQMADLLGFCSATIMRREIVTRGLGLAKNKIGTAWVSLFLVLYTLANGEKFYFLDGPNFISDPKLPNQKTWYDQFQVFAINLYDVVKEFEGPFSHKAVKQMLTKNLEGIWRGMLYYRSQGYTNGLGGQSATLRALASRYWTFPEFWLAAPLLLLPRPAVRVLYRTYKFFVPKTRNRINPDADGIRRRKKALITGLTGQDGFYLAELLLRKGYEVHGLIRERAAEAGSVRSRVLKMLGWQVILHYGNVGNPQTVKDVFAEILPDEIYHLAGQKQSKDREKDMLSFALNVEATRAFLEVIKELRPSARFFLAGSSEMFGRSEHLPVNESTPFQPLSPYAESKVQAAKLIREARKKDAVFAATGILFNHESPLRDSLYVTSKIVLAAVEISRGQQRGLDLGSLEARRDWGFAGDYAEAMWLMLQAEKPEDYVIGTGKNHSVEDFVRLAFETVGLDWQKYVSVKKSIPPSEIQETLSDPSKIERELGWRAKTPFPALVKMMVEAELKRPQTS